MSDTLDRQTKPQLVLPIVTASGILASALLGSAVAQRPMAHSELLAGATLGSNIVLNLVLALAFYGRGTKLRLPVGSLFLFASAVLLIQLLALAADAAKIPHPSSFSIGDLIWRGIWVSALAWHAWTSKGRPGWAKNLQWSRVAGPLAITAVVAGAGCDHLVATSGLPNFAGAAGASATAMLTLVAVIGVVVRLAPHSLGGVWLAVILAADLDELTMRSLGGGIHSMGFALGAATSLAARMLAFVGLFSSIQRRLAGMGEMSANWERLAYHDPLTNLANRRRFDERLQLEWRRAARNRTPLALVLFDVDQFKQYNDRYGHPNGDACLVRLATLFADNARRPGDLAARYGGEEFALLLPSTDAEGAWHLAERVREGVRRLAIPHEGNGARLVTVSAGVASVVPTDPRRKVAGLLEAADQALYRAKQAGRDRVIADPN